jgi:hypothetical protein
MIGLIINYKIKLNKKTKSHSEVIMRQIIVNYNINS